MTDDTANTNATHLSELWQWLEEQVWSQHAPEELGRMPTKEEQEEMLGYE